MIVPAKQTTTEVKRLNVEIDAVEVLYKIYWDLLDDKPPKAGYIEGGHWYVFWYKDYHKGVEEYKKDRAATPEELKIHDAYETLNHLVRKSKKEGNL